MEFVSRMQHLQDVLLSSQGQAATIYRPSTEANVYEGKIIFISTVIKNNGLEDGKRGGIRTDLNNIECLLPADKYSPVKGDVVYCGQSSYIVVPYSESILFNMDGFNSMIKIRLSRRMNVNS